MSSFDWKSHVVVVTGASAGIGAALAREVARRGGSVVLAARRAEKLREVAASLPAPSAVVAADVTKRDDVARILATALERFGGVDAWVNNAGRGISRNVADLTDDDIDAMIRDNVKSALYGMQAVLPHFKARRRGHIINVSSMLGRVPWVSIRSAYSAAKHALNSLTENLRMDLAKDFPDIRVTCVMPGVVSTDFGVNALGGGVDSRVLPGAQPAEEVATIIAETIASGRTGDVYTGADALERIVQYLRDLASGK
jgi:NADP-dependent 3-hydroxy acid dehydrogenase YdfG